MSDITLPYRYEPRAYQLPFLKSFDSGVFKRFILIWHRRSGKEKTVIQVFPREMIKNVGVYYYFFPTYAQGKKVLWEGIDKSGMRFLDHFPKELIDGKPNDTEMKIKFKNGSIFQVIGTDNIDSIVGTNPMGCAFSEYPLQSPKAWGFIRPILAENGGWAIFDYTPRGMNHGWKLLQQAKDNNWFWEILTVDQTSAISKEVLEQERKEMPEALFLQEYYCKFIEGAGQFFRRIDENIWEGTLEPEYGKSYRLGVDLAKYNDWTVLTPIDMHTFRVGRQEKFQKVDYNLQKARIEAVHLRYNRALTRLDSTGLGEPIYDDLSKVIQVEPYRFTERSRYDLLKNLAVLLEQDRIKLPRDQELIDQLRSFQWVLTEGGKLKLQVPEGLHDDMVMSLALAVWDIGLALGPVNIKDEVGGIYNTEYS